MTTLDITLPRPQASAFTVLLRNAAGVAEAARAEPGVLLWRTGDLPARTWLWSRAIHW